MHDVRILRLHQDQMPRHLADIYRSNIFFNNGSNINNYVNNNINYNNVNPSKEIPVLPYQHLNDNFLNNRSPVESPPLTKKQLRTSALIHPLHNNNVVITNSGSKDTDALNDHHLFFSGFKPQHELSKSASTNAIESIRKVIPDHQLQHIGKENGKSILKKSFPQLIQLRNVVDLQGSQKDRPRSVPCAPRRVDFRPNVLVFLFDKFEGGHVRSESQDLTSEPKDRKKFLIRNNSPIKQKLFQNASEVAQTNKCNALESSSSTVHIVLPQGTKRLVPQRLLRGSLTDDDLHTKNYIPGLVYKSVTPTSNVAIKNVSHKNSQIKDMNAMDHNNISGVINKKVIQHGNSASMLSNLSLLSPSPLPSPPLMASTNHYRQRTHSLTSDYHSKTDDMTSTINIEDIDFVFFEDENCRLWLRFMLDLGFGVSASDVLVKANLAGNKVRIVGTRLKNGIPHDFNERCTLPMEVDPYMIIARMDNNGKLFVEGLIMTPDRKKFLSRQQKIK